jgi:competence protein ComEC
MKRQQRVKTAGHGDRQLHISWQLASLCTSLLVGVALSALLDVSFFAAQFWLMVVALFIAIGLSRHTATYAVFFICAGFIAGAWRGSGEQLALQAYRPFYNHSVVVQGKVSEDISTGDKGDTRVQLTNIYLNSQKLHGKIWVSITQGAEQGGTGQGKQIKRNDTIQISGKMSEGFGNMAASVSSATLIGFQETSRTDAALHIRDWFANGVRRSIPEPQASLGSGFLTGQHSSLPATLDDQLRAVGLTHAVVASGSNLTVLVGFTRRLFSRASKFTATMAGVFMTAGFILIAGMSPSMSRAGLVTGLSLAAWYYGRRIHPLVLLPFSAAVTVMINPSYLWGDIGWYLSFTAFAGVLVIAPLLQAYFWGKDYKPNAIMEIFIGTSAAQIATMPVILFSFGTYSSYALIANLLVLPLVPLAMLLTCIGGIAGVTAAPIAQIFGWPASIIMKYMTTVIDRIANLPYAQGEIAYSVIALVGSYFCIAISIAYMWRKTSFNFRQGHNITIGERP